MARSRRPRGTGSYDKCGDFFRWRIGIYNPMDGKTHYKSIKAKSRAALDEKVEAWKEENGGGDALPPLPKRMTVKKWVDLWLEDAEGKKAAATMFHYRLTAKNHILPRFGTQQLGKVSPLELQAYFNELAKDCAPATVAAVRDHFSSCFEKAVKLGIISRNPVKMTDSPRKVKPELKILEESDVSRILAVAKDGSYCRAPRDEADAFSLRVNYLVVLLAVASGMRQGEILGLTWPCVHGTRLEVKHSLQNLSSARVLKAPKNGKPRVVAIPSAVAAELEAWRFYQAKYAEKYKGFYDNPLSLVFTKADGKVIDGSTFTGYYFRAIARTAKVEGVRFHDLRHFWASSAIAKGVNVAAVSEQLGHSSIQITLERYTHVLERSRDELRVMMEENPLFS